MTHLLGGYINLSKRLYPEPSHRCSNSKQGAIELKNFVANCRNPRSSWRIREKKQRPWQKKGKPSLVQSCSSSAAEEVEVVDDEREEEEEEEEVGNYDEGDLKHLMSEFGWRVRRLFENEREMRKVALIQAEAFHVPVAILNDLFFQFFQAEVLSALLYKLRNSAPNRYACLVAESVDDSQELVGVVDATILRDNDVLEHLDGAEEYLYISGIAVSEQYRRQKIATVLLKACDELSVLWGLDHLVLRAYEDDIGARELYTKAGYRVVTGDPPWTTSWIGRKRRVLMIKRSNPRDWT